jgi:hypothetical protein
MAVEQQHIYVYCHKCGERIKVAVIPMECGKFAKLCKTAKCPVCQDRKNIYMGGPPEFMDGAGI